MRLPAAVYIELYGGMAPGQTYRVNHDDCPSGTDRRRRLYITKSDDNTALKCYCHNCGEGTVINIKSAVPLRSVLKEEETKELVLPEAWKGATPIHPRHKLWLDAYGIYDHAAEREVYSMSEYELVFPVVQDELEGYQIRYFDGRKPKWKSRGNPRQWYGMGEYSIVTEDVVSAYKFIAATGNGYHVMAGHGHKLDPVFSNHTYIIWLDNDKQSVIDAALELAKAASQHKPAILIEGGTDPKRYTQTELRQVVNDCNELLKSPPADGRPYYIFKVWAPGEGVRP